MSGWHIQRVPAQCLTCGDAFGKVREDHVFCSGGCRERAKVDRRHERLVCADCGVAFPRRRGPLGDAPLCLDCRDAARARREALKVHRRVLALANRLERSARFVGFCEHCGTPFSRYSTNQRFCADRCRAAAAPACGVKDCGRPRVTKDLCNTHYKAKHGRGVAPRRSCASCGVAYFSRTKATSVCSLTCRDALKRRKKIEARRAWEAAQGRDLVRYVAAPRETAPPVTIIPSKRSPWIGGICVVCDTGFITLAPAKTCSDACSQRLMKATRSAAKTRRRLRLEAAMVELVIPIRVFERDDWICHLCREPIDRAAPGGFPRSASVDHLVPLSRDGEHSYANVKTAHWICNSVRGAKLLEAA